MEVDAYKRSTSRGACGLPGGLVLHGVSRTRWLAVLSAISTGGCASTAPAAPPLRPAITQPAPARPKTSSTAAPAPAPPGASRATAAPPVAAVDPRVAALPAAFRCDGARPASDSTSDHNLTAPQRAAIEALVVPGAPPRALDPALRGSLSRRVISERVDSNLAAVQWCFDTARTWTPAVHGRVAIKFAIAPDGAVAKAVAASNNTGMEDLGCCIARKVESWTFPPPSGGGIVIETFPFSLATVLPGPFRCEEAQADPRGRPHHHLTAPQRAAIEANLVPGAPLRPPEPALRGSLPKRAIRERIESNIAAVGWCLDIARKQTPEVHGRVAIHFAIAPDGGVAKAVVASNDTGVGELGCCIARQVELWTFPAPDGGGIVFATHPFDVGGTPAPPTSTRAGRPGARAPERGI